MTKPVKFRSDAPPVLREWLAFRARPTFAAGFDQLFRDVTDRKGHRLILDGMANRPLVLDRLEDLYGRTTRTAWGTFIPSPEECLAQDAVTGLIRAEVAGLAHDLHQHGHPALAKTLADLPLQFIDPYSFDSLGDNWTPADTAAAALPDRASPPDPLRHALSRAFYAAFERGPFRHVLGPALGDMEDYGASYQLYLSGYYYQLEDDGIMVACVHDWELPAFSRPPARGSAH